MKKLLFILLIIICLVIPARATYKSHLNEIGSGSGRAFTATLYVSADGSNTTGYTWNNAYQTLPAALDAASASGNAYTQIKLAPIATYYNMDITGDPTWSANVEIVGTHRNFAKIKNDHAGGY